MLAKARSAFNALKYERRSELVSPFVGPGFGPAHYATMSDRLSANARARARADAGGAATSGIELRRADLQHLQGAKFQPTLHRNTLPVVRLRSIGQRFSPPRRALRSEAEADQ